MTSAVAPGVGGGPVTAIYPMSGGAAPAARARGVGGPKAAPGQVATYRWTTGADGSSVEEMEKDRAGARRRQAEIGRVDSVKWHRWDLGHQGPTTRCCRQQRGKSACQEQAWGRSVISVHKKLEFRSARHNPNSGARRDDGVCQFGCEGTVLVPG